MFVTMEHMTEQRQGKIVENSTYLLTGSGCVRHIYTDWTALPATPRRDIVGRFGFEGIQELTLRAHVRSLAEPSAGRDNFR